MSTINIIIGIAGVLVLVVLLLMFRVQALLAVQRGSDSKRGGLSNRINGALFLVFMVAMFTLIPYYTFTGKYSLPDPASIHGVETDGMFLLTMAICGIVVVLTHILLFGFSYKYQYSDARKAKYFPEDNKLEIIWTVVPAIVLTVLVYRGWSVWSETMAPSEDPKKVEIEVVAQQFGWEFRYPGADGKFGNHDFRKIDLKSGNSLGIDFSDPNNVAGLDDVISSKLILPKGKEVVVKIRSKDVLHSFYLPHLRVKMDAVPGMPTYFKFTPTKTTQDMRRFLATKPDWTTKSKSDTTKMRWETFNYEVVCAEICGRGHFGMKGNMEVIDSASFREWVTAQTPWAVNNLAFVRSEIASSENEKAIKAFEDRIQELLEIEAIKNGTVEEETPAMETQPVDSTNAVSDTLNTAGL